VMCVVEELNDCVDDESCGGVIAED
jgi:hypothetical protein